MRVILDLRHNGGGSLTEAINLTGLFIDSRTGRAGEGLPTAKYNTTTTPSAGMAWNGPSGRADQQVQRQCQRDLCRRHSGLSIAA